MTSFRDIGIYEDDVESVWMDQDLWFGAVDAANMHNPITASAFIWLKFFKQTPVCVVECFCVAAP